MENIIPLYDEIAIIFSSPESFERYYHRELRKMELNKWKDVLERKLFGIYEVLKGVMIESVRPETVDVWVNKIFSLLKNADSIKGRIKDDLDRHIGYADLPEAIFLPDTIQDDMGRTGKTYEELEPEYLQAIKARTEVLQGIKLYVDGSYNVINFVLDKMKELQPSKGYYSDLVIKTAKEIKEKSNERENSLIHEISTETGESFEISATILIDRLFSVLTTSPPFIKEIKKEDFEKVFSSIPSSVTIDWVANGNQLGYFLKQLKTKGIIRNKKYFEVAARYFTVNGKTVKSELLRTNDSIGRDSKKRIDDLISKIKPDNNL